MVHKLNLIQPTFFSTKRITNSLHNWFLYTFMSLYVRNSYRYWPDHVCGVEHQSGWSYQLVPFICFFMMDAKKENVLIKKSSPPPFTNLLPLLRFLTAHISSPPLLWKPFAVYFFCPLPGGLFCPHQTSLLNQWVLVVRVFFYTGPGHFPHPHWKRPPL